MLEKSREKAIYMKRQMASELDTLRRCLIIPHPASLILLTALYESPSTSRTPEPMPAPSSAVQDIPGEAPPGYDA